MQAPEAIAEAYTWAFPLHAIARTRWQATANPANPQRHPPNTLRHIRHLSDHTSRWITAPNNDTLYSNAWLDLSAGPLRLSVAEQPPGRYWSVALLDAWTKHLAVVGQRLEGCGPVHLEIRGPDHPGEPALATATAPDRLRVIHSPGQDLWLFARCLVEGPDDLPQAHAMQDRITLHPAHAGGPTPSTTHPVPGEPTDAAAFLATVNHALARNPPPADEAAAWARWQAVAPSRGTPAPGRSAGDDAARQAAWAAHIGPAFERVRALGRDGRRQVQGWVTAPPQIGQFGRDHALRASVALGGLGALEPAEAVYFVRYEADDGQPLDGARRWQLLLPPGGLATDGFWSATLYQATPDGRRFFVDNPIRRYAIGNRTPGLQPEADGSLRVWLQPEAPAGAAARAHWLPTPADGLFQIALRCYGPRPALRDGLAPLPRLLPA